ncbi:MAG: class I SAM-dependent methyltransferase [Spirochaetales bacterium]|nr:class I SAM-dependent methyltransferase [Spirochaetales bacterium]
MFYTDFSEDYNEIFPFSRDVYSLLEGFLFSGDTPEARLYTEACPATGPSIDSLKGLESHITRKRRVLDLGCGTGKYCGKFTSGGTRTTGIDLDSGMIKKARESFPDSDFRVMNLTEISSLVQEKQSGGPSPFDLIYSTGNVMAHIDCNSFKGFLPEMKKLLSPGGIWIFQVMNWEFILKQDFFRFPEIESRTKVFSRTYTDISEEKLSFNTELKNKSDGESVFKESVTLYPVQCEEYIRMHEEEGFKLMGHYGNYEKGPFKPEIFSAAIYVFQKD